MEATSLTASTDGPFIRIGYAIAGIDRELMAKCPERDKSNALSTATLMACTFMYQISIFSCVGNALFARPGGIRFDIVLYAVFLAVFILLLDRYVFVIPSYYAHGNRILRNGGLQLPSPLTEKIEKWVLGGSRIFILAGGISQLITIGLLMVILDDDIKTNINENYNRNVAPIVAKATVIADAAIQRQVDAFNAENGRLAILSAEMTKIRQNEIDPGVNDPALADAQKELDQLLARQAKDADDIKAAETFASNEKGGIRQDQASGVVGQGPRYQAALEQLAGAKSRAQDTANAIAALRARIDALRADHAKANEALKDQAHAQRPVFENDVAVAEAKVAKAKADLDRLIHEREGTIRSIVEKSPDYVAPNDGFLARITALERMSEQDPAIKTVIILIELVSMGFELASVLAKTVFIPTTYAALLARDALNEAIRLAGSVAPEFPPDGPSGAAYFNREGAWGADHENDNAPGKELAVDNDNIPDSDEGPITNPKRPRGRPRKSPFA